MKPSVVPFGHGTVCLRLIEAEDLETTLQWRNRDDVRIWFKTSAVLSLDDHKRWFSSYQARDDDFLFVIEYDGRIVGQASVYRIDRSSGEAEVGRFLIAPEMRGKGVMSRACKALLEFCAESLHLSYVYLEVFADNESALRLYLRNGFVETGRNAGLIRLGRGLNPQERRAP